MAFDSSRFTFDAWRDFLGVVMQQGRVQLDSDWNELVSQFLRRMQVGTLDTMGPAVVPRETPTGFQITLADGRLKIGVGRMYVDGILAENHGGGAKSWNAGLAELQGKEPIDYDAQPYYPDPPELPQAGSSYVVYLDVWQREVTHLQYPELIEKAVGVDTTGRLQTVWQVKLLQLPVDGGLTCSSAASTKEWSALTRPSGARLTTSTGSVPDTLDPCQIPPSGGYKGLENQLYRVEIHVGGKAGTATFKWSRDNATVASRISEINPGGGSIVVESIGRDEVLSFSEGDWIEITDDKRELQGKPGVMRRIRTGNGIDISTRTIFLAEALRDPMDLLDIARNARVKRWDQRGLVRREDGTRYFDLDSSSDGLIPIPAEPTPLLLENGILVRFSSVPEGDFHTGDHWNFAARTADASIEILTDAPPRGVHHHYARLAVVNTPTDGVASPIASDCRIPWPPEVGTGHDCSCDRCVTPEGHNNGTATIQHAINALQKSGGVICLAAGYYQLKDTLSMVNVHTLRIRGRGWSTVLKTENPEIGSVVRINGSTQVVIEDLSIEGPVSIEGTTSIKLIDVESTHYLDLKHLFLFGQFPDFNTSFRSTGVNLRGFVPGFHMQECVVVAEVGIGGGREKGGELYTGPMTVIHNLFVGTGTGIDLLGASYQAQTKIAYNWIRSTLRAGVQIQGIAFPGSSCLIEANVLHSLGDGIRAGVDGLRITKNTISSMAESQVAGGVNGVVIKQEPDLGDIHCWITENHISSMGGSGIAVRTSVASAIIKQNVIERTKYGIVFSASAEQLSIENNHLLDTFSVSGPEMPAVAIQVVVIENHQAEITGNVVKRFATNSTNMLPSAAILVLGGGDVHIYGNRLIDVGPLKKNNHYLAGIELIVPFKSATISDNTITRSQQGDVDEAQWQAIRVLPPTAGMRALADGVSVIAENEKVFRLLANKMYELTAGLAYSAAVKITGNEVVGHKVQIPLVEVGWKESESIIFFTNNCCKGGQGPRSGAVVVLTGSTAIISHNSIQMQQSDLNSIAVSVDNVGNKGKFTAIGNITNGRVLINGQLLNDPWKQLNLTEAS